eukprot:403339354
MARVLDYVDIDSQVEFKDGLTYVDYLRKEFQDVRDYMLTQLKENFDLPVEPLKSESGYFLMVNVSKCREFIPEKYLKTHDYENLISKDENGNEIQLQPISRNIVYMPDGSIPLDLAFCRWMAVERGVIMMPASVFYNKDSPYKDDKCVRLAICKGLDHSAKAINRLKGKKKLD